ncbi:hypothetical protein WG66_002360, partial [Moniliophthora roreri]
MATWCCKTHNMRQDITGIAMRCRCYITLQAIYCVTALLQFNPNEQGKESYIDSKYIHIY